MVATAQHRSLLDQALADFGIAPDLDLDLMETNQTLASLTSRLVARMDEVLAQESPDFVLARGDTTTVLTTALCCFYRGISFGHVEAGLRTHQRRSPFPEEMNMVVAGYLANLHFAPTKVAREHLFNEGIESGAIHLTGNTGIDALLYQAGRDVELPIATKGRLILVTAHRRENFGARMRSVCTAIAELAARYHDVEFLFPVHPNPNVAGIVHELLGQMSGVHLCAPLDYPHFVAAIKRAYLVLTDSGGVQEEAPALAKPVLVMRTETERPEAVAAGVAKLIGTEHDRLVGEVSNLLDDEELYRRMAKGISPYGDGQAAQRIVAVLARRFGRVVDPARDPAPFQFEQT